MSIIDNAGKNENTVKAANTWDHVAHLFRERTGASYVYAPGQDNYEIIWPVLNNNVIEQYKNVSDMRVCDFGCGTGMFSEQITKERGCQTFAYDISPNMIQQARQNSNSTVTYTIGGVEAIEQHSPYNIVISIMVLQFIEHPDTVLKSIKKCLKDGGTFFFAVHNIEYAHECLKHKVKFRNCLEHNNFTSEAEILIGDSWIKTFLRTPDWYDNMITAEGFTRIGHSFEFRKPPLDVLRTDETWNSTKYYISWYCI